MTIMISEIFDALIDAGATEEKSRRAAEAMAGYDNRLAAIDTRLAVLTWMTGANTAMTLAVLVKLFLH
jgi:hypothetical protein